MAEIPLDYLAELTTVASRYAVVHQAQHVHHHDDLRPDSEHEIDGFSFRTLPEPGEHLCTFTAVNDVHFGEEVCGLVHDNPSVGPSFRSLPGEPPYPLTMNQGAIEEMSAIDPLAVVVKGDLTSEGTRAEYDQFLTAYGTFGDRLLHMRGNHDVCGPDRFATDAHQRRDLPGVTLALIDTSIEGRASGQVTADQLEWLDAVAAEADRPVLVFGHHHAWNPASVERPASYFGINPDDSERLVEVVARRPRIAGYFAGHTHRNRVRQFPATGSVPWVEVACVKDYPGSWAEYRVHEGGILQIHHRISTPEALSWTERTRQMYHGLYDGYAFGSLEDRCFTIPVARER